MCDQTSQVEGSGLPVNRWAAGTDQFHSRLGTKAWNDVAEKMQRQGVMSVMYGAGNVVWTTTTGLTETAINFCVLDRVGGTIDHAAARIGTSIMSSGVVAAFVVAALLVWAWRVGRASGGGADTSMLLQKVLVVGLFGLMLAGAAASTGGTPNVPSGSGPGSDAGAGEYEPGFGSPGYFVVTIDNLVAASANEIVTNVADTTGAVSGAEQGWDTQMAGRNGYLGCAPYVKAMKDLYKQRYTTAADPSGSSSGSSGGRGGSYLEASASVPLMLSSMWEQTGLQMWTKAQFGDSNRYGAYMYCRVLEYHADSPRQPVTESGSWLSSWLTGTDPGADRFDTSVESLMKRAYRNAGHTGALSVTIDGNTFTYEVDDQFLAWRYSGSNTWRDRTWVGWAACARPDEPGGENDPGRWLVHEDGGASEAQLADKCKELFTRADWDGGGGGGEFDWDDSDDDITGTETSEAAKDYLLSLHGNKNRAGLISGFVYMLSSLMIGAVFLLFAFAILVAKIAGLVMMLLVYFALLVALLPSMSAGKVADYAKQYVGLSLFAWAAQLLLSILALITSVLVEIGGAMVPAGPGGVMALMWTGFAPILAAFCMHLMFKKMRIPSPLKPSSGLAWGQLAANGAIAGAAGAGGAALGSRFANGMTNRAKSAAVNHGKATASGLVGRERRNRMAPGTPNTGPPGNSPNRATGTGPNPTRGQETDARAAAETARAAKAEKRAAEEFARSPHGRQGLAEVEKAHGRGAAAHVRDRLTNAAAQFKDKPVHTTAKAAALGVGALTAGTFVGAGALPIAAGAAGAALVGRSGLRKTMNAASRQWTPATADKIEAFRNHRTRINQAHTAALDEARRLRAGEAEANTRTALAREVAQALRTQAAEEAAAAEQGAVEQQIADADAASDSRFRRPAPGRAGGEG